jgi:hypothetical protein
MNPIAPNDEPALAQRVKQHMERQEWQLAEQLLQALDRDYPGRYLAQRALCVFNQKRYAEALPLLQSLVDAGNTDVACILAYAACLERTGEESAAIDVLNKLYRALPTEQFAVMLASALLRVSRPDLLEQHLPMLLAAHPGNASLLSMQSEFLLARGDFGNGFDLAHHRWANALEAPAAATLPCAEWDGQPFSGTLLVTAEQGLGDEILVSSMYEDLLRIGQHALIACDARLLPVYSRSFPALQFTDRHGNALAEAATAGECRKICGPDLGRIFRRRREDFPARSGWLSADAAKTAAISQALRARFPGQRLTGMSWRSARLQFGDAKSIPLTALEPLLREPGTTFIDLQYGDTRADLEHLHTQCSLQVQHINDINNTQDIDTLLALIAALDDVVSSSNSTVHLAAALGKAVYTLIPGTRYALWYWGYDGARTPWYPGVRLYRGPQRKPWHALAQDVAADRRLAHGIQA